MTTPPVTANISLSPNLNFIYLPFHLPIFEVTGQETLDVVSLPQGQPGVSSISTDLVRIPNGHATLVRLAVTNPGDAPVWDLTVNVSPGLQSALGINGLNPALITSPDIPATLFSTILPIGIAGHTYFYLGEVPAGGLKEYDVYASF